MTVKLRGLQKLKFNNLEWTLKKHSKSAYSCIQKDNSKSKPFLLTIYGLNQ